MGAKRLEHRGPFRRHIESRHGPIGHLAGAKLRDASLLSVVRTSANLANSDLPEARLDGYFN